MEMNVKNMKISRHGKMLAKVVIEADKRSYPIDIYLTKNGNLRTYCLFLDNPRMRAGLSREDALALRDFALSQYRSSVSS